MKIYIICSVRNATEQQIELSRAYARTKRREGHTVFFPPDDADQSDLTGWDIVTAERKAVEDADEIHVIWDKESSGSHFDLGMAFALRKTVRRVFSLQPDLPGKSYWKVMERWEAGGPE